MPYPSANDLYEVASSLNERDSALVRAAADELVERRRAMRDKGVELRMLADRIGHKGLVDLADDLRLAARSI